MIEPSVNTMQRALDCLNNDLGKQYILSEKLPGKSGAWAVESLEGEQGILKVAYDNRYEAIRQTVWVVEHLRAAGYPTPRPLHHGSIPGGGCFYLQERLPGLPMRSPGVWSALTQHELDLLLRQLELHKGIAPPVAEDWTCRVEEVALYQQGAWTVVAQSPLPVVQQLLQACERRCAELGNPGLKHNDFVHGDFGPHNVLLNTQGQVTAVFDLEGTGKGDRVIDIVGLLYMVEPELLQDVRYHALQAASPAALTACGVYWLVHRLAQGIRARANNLESVANQMLIYVDLLI